MRIAVMGAGGVGGCLGALLARGGNDVTLIARGDHLAAIQANGIRLLREDDEFIVPVKATANPAEAGPVELILYTVKTYHNLDAIPALRPLAGPETTILTLQNGVQCHQEVEEELGSGHALPGAYWTSSQVEAPGVVRCIGQTPRLTLGEPDGTISKRALSIRDCLTEAGIEAEVSEDAMQVIWSKFVVLSCVAGITSAARTRIKRFIGFPEGRELFVAALREVDAVGRAKGVNLPPGMVDQSLEFIEGFPDFQNSMHADFEHGRPTELEALSGAVVRLGRETGVPTPVHQFIYSVLLPLKDGAAV